MLVKGGGFFSVSSRERGGFFVESFLEGGGFFSPLRSESRFWMDVSCDHSVEKIKDCTSVKR